MLNEIVFFFNAQQLVSNFQCFVNQFLLLLITATTCCWIVAGREPPLGRTLASVFHALDCLAPLPHALDVAPAHLN